MKALRKTFPGLLLVILAAFLLPACAPAADPTARRLNDAGRDVHSAIDHLDYPGGEEAGQRLHAAADLALAATSWQLAVYFSPQSGVQAAAADVRRIVESAFPAAAQASVLDEMADAGRWKSEPSTATLPPALLALELENQGLAQESVLFEMAFMRFGAIAGSETLRDGLQKRQDGTIRLGEVILENNLTRARERLSQIPPGYAERLDGFFGALKDSRLRSLDALNIQEEEMDDWFADLISMLLQTWSAG